MYFQEFCMSTGTGCCQNQSSLQLNRRDFKLLYCITWEQLETTDPKEDKLGNRIWLHGYNIYIKDLKTMILNGLIKNNSEKIINMKKMHENCRVEQVENQVWNWQIFELRGKSGALLLDTVWLELNCWGYAI